jgi:hypothetical protein
VAQIVVLDMAFSLFVELLNLRVRARTRHGEPVQLHQRYDDASASSDHAPAHSADGQEHERE